MLTQKQKDQYWRDGYLLVPDILTTAQVRWLRAFFRPKFEAPKYVGDTHHWLLDIFGRYPELRWLCFHEPSLTVLRSLFGTDMVFLPDHTAHFNYFGRWHKDTGSFDRAGRLFFKEKEFHQWGVVYYLQDNTVAYGGGLDIEPGSQNEEDDPFIRPPAFRERGLTERIWHQFNRRARRSYWQARQRYDEQLSQSCYEPDPRKVLSIPSLAGDMIVFNARVNHRATPAQGITPDRDRLGGWIRRGVLPLEHEKLAVFTSWSRDNSTVRAYLDWTRNRWEYPHMRNLSYPADFVQEAEKAGLKLVF